MSWFAWGQPNPPPQLGKRTNNSDITAEEKQRYGYNDYKFFKENDGEGPDDGEDPDLGVVEDIGQRRIIRRILGVNVTINGASLYAIQHRQIILQTNCELLTEAEIKDLSFRLPIEGLPVGSGYKLIEIGTNVYKVCMKYHTAIESFKIRMGRSPDKQKRYDDLDAIFNGVFTRLIKQYDTINIERVKYLFVERVNNTNNVNVNGVTYHIDTGVNRVKEIEQQGNVFISDKLGEGITVNLGRLIPILVEGGYKQMSVDDTVPKFESEMLEEEMEEVSELHNTLGEAYSNITPLQDKLIKYGSFFDALFVELHSRKYEWDALSNMNSAEFKNFLKKIFHVVINSHLSDVQMIYYKTRLRSYYGHLDHPAVRGKTYYLVDKLRTELTDQRDISLLKHTHISETVPVIDEHYYNGRDRTWMDHYISNLTAMWLAGNSAKGNIFGDKIRSNLDEIEKILDLDGKDMVIEAKNELINQQLQSIKHDFLGRLIALISKVELLGDIIGKSFGIDRDSMSGVLVNSDDVDRTEQLIDHVLNLLLTARLDRAEELTAIEVDLAAAMADDPDDFEGGSRLKRKSKLKKTKKRNKKYRKQNKSKRHKGYSRR